ncbi:L-serine ammonia-lyase, partial [Francisella tularensis subsp. holarctica]|nr:L-serine ammonia-lyase [Francisella tularensis subsp. holarctica]
GEELLCEIEYFSIGCCFIVDKKQIKKDSVPTEVSCDKPYKFTTMAEVRERCQRDGKTSDEIRLANEKTAEGGQHAWV